MYKSDEEKSFIRLFMFTFKRERGRDGFFLSGLELML